MAKIIHSAFCTKRISPTATPEEALAQNHVQLPNSPLDVLSPTSTASPTFSSNLPTRRHSVQPGLTFDIIADMKASALHQFPFTEEEQKAQPKKVAPEEAARQSSWDEKVSTEPIVKDADGMRVLLVEDNEINLKLLVACMRKLKLNHATACNGLEAVNAYKEAHDESKHFDVIFMGRSLPLPCIWRWISKRFTDVLDLDISMPIMSGIESTQHIRRFEREHGLTPVALIALTGAANPNTRQEAFSSGVDMFLTKPVPMKSLKVMLDDLKANGRFSMVRMGA